MNNKTTLNSVSQQRTKREEKKWKENWNLWLYDYQAFVYLYPSIKLFFFRFSVSVTQILYNNREKVSDFFFFAFSRYNICLCKRFGVVLKLGMEIVSKVSKEQQKIYRSSFFSFLFLLLVTNTPFTVALHQFYGRCLIYKFKWKKSLKISFKFVGNCQQLYSLKNRIVCR